MMLIGLQNNFLKDQKLANKIDQPQQQSSIYFFFKIIINIYLINQKYVSQFSNWCLFHKTKQNAYIYSKAEKKVPISSWFDYCPSLYLLLLVYQFNINTQILTQQKYIKIVLTTKFKKQLVLHRQHTNFLTLIALCLFCIFFSKPTSKKVFEKRLFVLKTKILNSSILFQSMQTTLYFNLEYYYCFQVDFSFSRIQNSNFVEKLVNYKHIDTEK
eukprot:TRINITY_DN903_c0_g1_i17.p3 TRINITY_DN903_c0_g1~~TRINITY_DN903_c0_g1_i17.p3  ORF type:complete len:214 (-),score=-1.32 TRINITY_DN903_c0_g1_i17:508-1149(-)